MNYTKKCYICKKFKPLLDFYKDRSRCDGVKTSCKFCDNLRIRTKKHRKYKYKYVPSGTNPSGSWIKLTKEERKNKAKEKLKISNYRYERTVKGRYRNAAKIALKRPKFTWNISFEDYEALLNSGCFYCSRNLHTDGVGVNLDRIDNSRKEYSIDNVLPCCKQCNQIRGQYLTIEETKIAAIAIENYRNECKKETL